MTLTVCELEHDHRVPVDLSMVFCQRLPGGSPTVVPKIPGHPGHPVETLKVSLKEVGGPLSKTTLRRS